MKHKYTKATSAGGVIVKIIDNEPRVLILMTNESKGFLPKGHVESGESLEEAAFREVYEEAGLKELKILENLGNFQRFVDTEDVKEDKTIHFFLMTPTKENEQHTITADNGDLEFKWYPLDDLPEMYLEENRLIIENNIDVIRELIR